MILPILIAVVQLVLTVFVIVTILQLSFYWHVRHDSQVNGGDADTLMKIRRVVNSQERKNKDILFLAIK